MVILKKKIKSLLPDRMVYLYYTLRKFPKYIKAIWDDRLNKYPEINFFDDKTTVDKIINERMSLSRFGDGEFLWMTGEHLNSYQDYSENFSYDLKKSFQSKNKNLLIGIPYGIVNSKECNLHAKMHWKIIKANCYKRILEFADLNKTYCNASITRPYIDYCNYELSTNKFNNLKRIWENRDIVFIEGEKTKLGIGNDLFDNAKSIKRIICPAENAYEKKDNIKDVIVKNIPKNVMILAALGPTASILAVEMTDLGYQFIDIGHVDVEYIWYQRHAILREAIDGKYVNESGSKVCSNLYDDDHKYLSSIIYKVL